MATQSTNIQIPHDPEGLRSVLADLEPGCSSLEEAQTFCRALCKHYENFTVGSRLFPRHLRPTLEAVYAYARFADDLGDELPPVLPPGWTLQQVRMARLDHWRTLTADIENQQQKHPVLFALAASLRRDHLELQPFLDLLSAFRQDQWRLRYQSDVQLLDYCCRSADPVGRIMLQLFGIRPGDHRWARAVLYSDDVCSALQLANFWQDLSQDLADDRCYIPRNRLKNHQLSSLPRNILKSGERFDPLLKELCGWSRQMLRSGDRLLPLLPRRARFEVKLFIGGGHAILDAVEALGHRVLKERPSVGSARKLQIALSSAAVLLSPGPGRR